MARLTQSEILANLAERTGLKPKDITNVLEALADLAVFEVKRNSEFTLPGFGKLIKTARAPRKGRNPATGEVVAIPARVMVRFRIGKALKEELTLDLSETIYTWEEPVAEEIIREPNTTACEGLPGEETTDDDPGLPGEPTTYDDP